MASTFGNSVRVSLFGQSHAPAVGAVVEGLPAGFAVDTKALARTMARRAPGGAAWSTPRKEADEVRILSGLTPEGLTSGTPLALEIANTNTRSADYGKLRRIPRPGHADWPALVKWGEAHDIAGGGHFSARLTAPLVAAGAICSQILESKGVRIAAHAAEIAGVADEPFCALDTTPAALATLSAQMDALADGRDFPTVEEEAGSEMQAAIAAARADGDSVGGIVECVACGLPTGIGGPIFDGLENRIAQIAFGIPAVKGIEFGRGFHAASMRGSEHNDPYTVRRRKVQPASNNAGGILGGLSTGEPILFRVAFKPTSSIAREQDSVDLETRKAAKLEVRGRHDPCVVPRAVPIVEAACAVALLDAWISSPVEGEPFRLG